MLNFAQVPVQASTTPSFLGLQDTGLRNLLAQCEIRGFPKNAIVINESEHTDSIYLIRSGRVKIVLLSEKGKELELNVLEVGDYFGEMALDEGPRSASVVTLEPSRFFVIPKALFRDFVAEHPDFALRLIQTLIRRTRGLLKNIKSLTFLDVYGRVARLLLDLAKEQQDGRLVVTRKLTKQGIANQVGASREMISRVFKDLIANGYIVMNNKQITIGKTTSGR